MTTPTLTLSAFVLARIAEDEAIALDALEPTFGATPTFYTGMSAYRDDWGLFTFHVPVERVLATCKAHRAIVEGHRETWAPSDPPDYMDGVWASEDHTIRALASIWADHPEYDSRWSL